MAEIDQDNVNKILDALIKKGATPATEATLEEVRDLFSGRKTGGLGTVVKDFATGTGSLKDRFKRLAGAITDVEDEGEFLSCLLYTSPSPRDVEESGVTAYA